jgi:hypothetical protein
MSKSGHTILTSWALIILVSFLVAGIPVRADAAQKPGVKLDTQKPQIRRPGDNNYCPPNFTTIYLSHGKFCARCGTGYTPVKSKGRIICIRGDLRPIMRVPNGYQPKFNKPNAKGGCPPGQTLAKLPGLKACVKCKPGHRFHPYYGQGRCVACKDGEALQEIGGKIMCLRCPGNSMLVGIGRPGGPMRSICTCPNGGVFGWGDKGYGCYRLP